MRRIFSAAALASFIRLVVFGCALSCLCGSLFNGGLELKEAAGKENSTQLVKKAHVGSLSGSQKIFCCFHSSSDYQELITSFFQKKILHSIEADPPFQITFTTLFRFNLWKPSGSYQFHRLNVLASQAHPPTLFHSFVN